MLHCELKPGNIFMITEIYLYFKNIVYNILFLVTLWIFSMWELGNDTQKAILFLFTPLLFYFLKIQRSIENP